MADDKQVVTKKTTAKAASAGAPATRKGSGIPATGSREPAPAAASVPKKTTAKRAPAPAAQPPAAAPPRPAAARKGAALPTGSVEDCPVTLKPGGDVTPEERWRMVADAAYYRAERRDFAPGYEQEDWLAAEAEVGDLLRQRSA